MQALLDITASLGKFAHICKACDFLLPFMFQIPKLLFQLLPVTSQQTRSSNKLFGEALTGELLYRLDNILRQA